MRLIVTLLITAAMLTGAASASAHYPGTFKECGKARVGSGSVEVTAKGTSCRVARTVARRTERGRSLKRWRCRGDGSRAGHCHGKGKRRGQIVDWYPPE